MTPLLKNKLKGEEDIFPSLCGMFEEKIGQELEESKRGPCSSSTKVLITGGAGFIGSHTADLLLSFGYEVAIVDNFNPYYDPSLKRANISYLLTTYGEESFMLYEGDICDTPFMESIFDDFPPDFVIHLAARAGVRPSIEEPNLYVETNIEGTTTLLSLSAAHNVKHFVFASSSSVYGDSSLEVFREDDNTDSPLSPYGATKKACELLAFTYSHLHSLPCTGLRFFTVYGPRCRPDMAPFKFISRVAGGEKIQRFGDGSTSRDYTFVGDIVDGIARAMLRPNGFQVFNLGCGNPVRLSTFISLVEENVGKEAIIEELPPQPGDVPRTSASVEKAREELGFQPKVNIEEGIKITVEWYKEYMGMN